MLSNLILSSSPSSPLLSSYLLLSYLFRLSLFSSHHLIISSPSHHLLNLDEQEEESGSVDTGYAQEGDREEGEAPEFNDGETLSQQTVNQHD